MNYRSYSAFCYDYIPILSYFIYLTSQFIMGGIRVVSPKQYRRMLRPAHTWEEYKRGKGYLSKCMKYWKEKNEEFYKKVGKKTNYVGVWAGFDIFVQK